MPIYQSITELIGNTPLLELHHFVKDLDLPARILVKLEGCNPAGSAKDRIALSMIEDAEAKGLLFPDSTIIEPTSGNTGIGLAAIAAARGYRVLFTMPDTMSAERQKLLRAYGAEVVLTEGALGMQGAIEKAKALAKDIPHSFIPAQFDNPANPEAHLKSTGPEIWRDTEGSVDVFIAGVGTGGTLSGTGRYLKQQKPSVQVIAVEPAKSPLLSKGESGSHGLQGIGANFIPNTLDRSVYDEVIPVLEEDAYGAGRALARDGLLCGISGGAALHAAILLAKRPEYKGACIVVLLPDGGERYLSTALFQG